MIPSSGGMIPLLRLIHQTWTNCQQYQISSLRAKMSQNQTKSLFHSLPTELLRPVIYAACTPVVDDDPRIPNSTSHGMPDLTFRASDPRVRLIQDEEVLPESVLFVVRQQTCEACDSHNDASGSYPFVFTDVYQQPFNHFLRHASVVIIALRCGATCKSPVGDTKSAAFYSRFHSLNLMLLSRMIMMNSRTAQFVDIRCIPRSRKGAATIMDFLKSFSELTYGLTRGDVSFSTDAYSSTLR